jgi:hypothetical protein
MRNALSVRKGEMVGLDMTCFLVRAAQDALNQQMGASTTIRSSLQGAADAAEDIHERSRWGECVR